MEKKKESPFVTDEWIKEDDNHKGRYYVNFIGKYFGTFKVEFVDKFNQRDKRV